MKRIRGIVTIAQESRFQLTDEEGAAHLFLLSPKSAAEPQQLVGLQKQQSRIEVRYTEAHNIIGMVAHDIRLVPARSRFALWRTRRPKALIPWK